MERRPADFWLYKKHINNIEITNLYAKALWKQISIETGIMLSYKHQKSNAIFQWSNVKSFNFLFDYDGCEAEISNMLETSLLSTKKDVLVETSSDMPMFKVKTPYFIKHWYEFISANNGMGSIVISDDYRYLLEFTDDAYYLLFSNSKIK